jgi:hypothetical protein
MHLWEEHQASIKRVGEEIGKLPEELNRDNKHMEVTSRRALAYSDALTKGVEQVESGAEKYLKEIKRDKIRLMNKPAAKYNFMIYPT